MNKIPSVNLLDFISNDPKRKQKFVNQIGEAYEAIGFVALKVIFWSDNLSTDTLYTEIKKFFEFSTRLTKQSSYEVAGIGGQRGYVSFGKESAKGRERRRFKRVLALSDSM